MTNQNQPSIEEIIKQSTYKERFTIDNEGKYWDKINHEYVTLDSLFKTIKELDKEIAQLTQEIDYWKQVASQCNNELNVFEHYKRHKKGYWSENK